MGTRLELLPRCTRIWIKTTTAMTAAATRSLPPWTPTCTSLRHRLGPQGTSAARTVWTPACVV